MKKIIFVLSVTQIGGVTSSLINLLKEINNPDLSIYVVSLDNIQNEEIKKIATYLQAPKNIQYLMSSFKDTMKMVDFFDKLKVITVKVLSKVFGFKRVLYHFCKKSKIKIDFDYAISYSNDIFLNNRFSGGANAFVLYSLSSKQKIGWIHNDPQKYGFNTKNSYETYSKFDKIVNVSFACKKVFDTLFPDFCNKSYVVWNMIDYDKLSTFKKTYQTKDNKCFTILTVARIDNQQKRIDRAIDAAKLLKKDNVFFKWLFVGDGSDMASMRDYAKKQDVDDCVEFLGSKQNPFPYITESDLFVLTSDYESFGIVLLEAMYLGCPVISTDFAAANEVIKSDEMGIIAHMSAESIYEAIKTMLDEKTRKNYKNYLTNYHFSNNDAKEQFFNMIGD